MSVEQFSWIQALKCSEPPEGISLRYVRTPCTTKEKKH